MSDDVDEFLGSLGHFSTPSLSDSVSQFIEAHGVVSPGPGSGGHRERRREKKRRRHGEGEATGAAEASENAAATPQSSPEAAGAAELPAATGPANAAAMPSEGEGLEEEIFTDGDESSSATGTSAFESSGSSDSDDDDPRSPHGDLEAAEAYGHLRAQEVIALLETLPSVDPQRLPLVDPPPGVQLGAQLKPFQRQAFGWLRSIEDAMPQQTPGGDAADNCVGGIYSDYMGLGKTRTLIAHCEATRPPRSRIDRLAGSRVSSTGTLIVCPVSIMRQWAQEIKTVTSCLPQRPTILFYYGSTKRRMSIFQIAGFDYVITSYSTLAAEHVDADMPGRKCVNIVWHRVILDEAHCIRNPRTRQSRACCALRAQRRWAVSATPIQNRLLDLFSLFKFLRTPVFSDLPWFSRNIIAKALSTFPDDHTLAMTQLGAVLARLLLRRRPSTLVDGQPILVLPPKTVVLQPVELSEDERDFYDAVYNSAAMKLDTILRRRTTINKFATAFEMLTRCRQALLHPYLVVLGLKAKAEREGAALTVGVVSGDGDERCGQDMRAFVAQLKRNLKTKEEFAAHVVQEVVERRVSEQECIICIDVVNRPAILPCGHVFCEECVTTALAVKPECPLCKRKTRPKDLTLVPDAPAPIAPGIGPLVGDLPLQEHSEWMVSSKARALLEALAAVSPDDRVIVFCAYVSFLRYLKVLLEGNGHTTALYHGGLSARQRDELLRAFNRTNGPRILLASIATCSVGLNLVRARHAFIMEPTWNPGVEEQAMNRIHRIGQQYPVQIVRFIVPNTIEDRIVQLALSKSDLGESCIDRRATTRLSQNQIRELFAISLQRDTSERSSDPSQRERE